MTSAIAGLFYAAVSMPLSQAAIVVAYESGVDAYAEAMAGMQAGLDPRQTHAIDLRAATGEADLARLLSATDTKLVIAVGSHALAEVQAHRPVVPVMAAMVAPGAELERLAGRVDLDVSLSAQLDVMHGLLPRCLRVGMIHNPARSRYTAEALEARARKLGFTLVVVECGSAAQLLKAMASLKGKVDFLLCSPDPDLYNAVTIKPLILASIDLRLPIVGFSPAFVRAGAAAGIYPDYREIGRQAAAMANRFLRGEERMPWEEPARVQVAINQRVARLLGVDFQTRARAVEVLR